MESPQPRPALLIAASTARCLELLEPLTSLGFTPNAIADHADLETALAGEPLALVVIDHPLEWAEPLALLPMLRAAHPGCGLVLIAAGNRPELVASAFDAGLDAYVPAPAIDLAQIEPALRCALARAASRAHRPALSRHELEEQLQLRDRLLDAAPFGVAIVDTQLRYRWLNLTLAAQNQYPREQHIGQAIAAVLPDLAPVLEPLLTQVLVTQTPVVDFEIVEQQPALPHNPRVWLASYYPLTAPDDRSVGIGGIISEVTAQRQADQALARADDQYRRLFEHHPTPMWVFDHETLAFLAVNDAAVEQYGYSRDEFLAMTIADIRPPEDLPRLTVHVAAHREGLYQGEIWRHRRKDGAIILVDVRVYRTPFQGRPASLVQATNVTSQLETASALQTMETRLRTTVSSLPMILFALDQAGTFTLALGAGMAPIGESTEQVIGRPVAEVAREFPLVLQHIGRAMNGETFTATAQVRGRTFETRYMPLHDERGAVREVLGVSFDITAQVELQQQLWHAQRQESLGRLAGGVAHDFNNLLTVIAGYTELARLDLPPDSPALASLAEVQATTERAMRLTRQLLTIARRQPVTPEPLSLNDLIHGLAPLLRQLAGPHVVLRLELDPSLPLVMADAGQIEQVLMNLVINARDAMPEGGTLTITSAVVRLSQAVGDGTATDSAASVEGVSITVADTGIGMDAGVLAHLFEPFFTTKEPDRGTGLGLATCYGIVRQHGGTITASSAPGAGSAFTVTLPAHPHALQRDEPSPSP